VGAIIFQAILMFVEV